MKKIYIVLTHTGTVLSKIIYLLTKSTYTHASISLDVNMDGMYSFGRLNPYNPFIGGFVKEGINIGTFRRFKNTKTAVYSLKITEEEYQRIKEIITEMSVNRNDYKFNVIGLLYALFHKRYIRENRFYCSEFVRHLLEKSNIQVKGISHVIKPEDFRNVKKLRLVYVGLLRKYNYNSAIDVNQNMKSFELLQTSQAAC